MKSWIAITIVAFIAIPIILEAQATDTVAWKAYQNKSGGYEIRYPNALSLSVPSGTSCSNGECQPIEQVVLMGSNSTDGKAGVNSMSFIIQRGINPQHLPIQQWYEALAQRPIQPDWETAIAVGGKSAIRSGPLFKAATVQPIRGKTVSASKGTESANTVYVPLNDTDVLTISIPSSGSALGETFERVLATVTFRK
jgi:hypothetical protein